MTRKLPGLALLFFAASCLAPEPYDVVIRGGTIYDGSGEEPFETRPPSGISMPLFCTC